MSPFLAHNGSEPKFCHFITSLTNLLILIRVETDGIWRTSQDPSLRWNGYIEFRGTMPTRKNWKDYYCAFPAWWLWAYNWPHNGEIDIIETKNGKPYIQMALHSTNAK